MTAIQHRCFGSPDVLTLEQVEKPVPGEKQVLVKVKAAGVNPLDWHYLRGEPYIMRLMGAGTGTPADSNLGVDFAGVVESVGPGVTRFQAGDRVFGGRTGAYGEYVVLGEDRAIARIPENVSFEQAAAVPVAAITALQALRDKGNLQAGQKVLINGASGGVGTYAVQIAKNMGAEVHGVCSTRNVDMVESLGADRVIDYKKENYTENDVTYDLIIDNVGNHPLLDNRKVMTADGTLVIVGSASSGKWLGPLLRPIYAMIIGPFVDQDFSMFISAFDQGDLEYLAELMAAGQLTSVIDRRYALAEVPDAIRYSESGRARGKIIIEVDPNQAPSRPFR